MNPAMGNREVHLELTLLQVMIIHGNMCLALRHPANQGPSTQMARELLKRLGESLVAGGLMTPEELRLAERVEIEQTRRTMRS